MDFIINYLFITVPEFYIFILFSIILFGYKLSVYKFKILYMALITGFISDILWFFNVNIGIRIIITFVTVFLLYLIIIKSKWLMSLLMTVASFAVLTILEIFLTVLLMQFVDINLILENLFLKFLVIFIEYIPVMVAIYIMYKKDWNLSKLIKKMQNNRIAIYWIELLFLLMLQIYFIIYLNYSVYIQRNILLNKILTINNYVLILSSIIIIINVIIVKVIINLKNKYAEVEVSKTENDYNESLEKLLVKLRMERHDNISQIQAVYGMVAEEKYDMLKEYLADIVDNIRSSSINYSFSIKNIPVSAFIHTKMESIKSEGINFNIIVETTDTFKEIKGVDLIKIIGNLLDNAMRAISENKTKNSFIEFYWGKEKNNAFIKISNNGPKINKNMIDLIFKEGYTTKENMMDNGYGLSIVKSIVNKYKGNIDVKSTKEVTSFAVKIPLDNKR